MSRKIEKGRGLQTINRKKDRERFVTMERTFLDDIELSAKAKGVFAHILGFPDNWKLIVEHLIKQFTDGRDSIQSALLELRRMGYLEAVEFRIKGKVYSREYFVYEQPFYVDRENFQPRKVRIIQLKSEDELETYRDSHYDEERTMREVRTFLSLSPEERAELGKNTAIRRPKKEKAKPKKKRKQAKIDISEELDDLFGGENEVSATVDTQEFSPQTENPVTAPKTENPSTGNPVTEKPSTENPPTGKPPAENPQLLINNSTDVFKSTDVFTELNIHMTEDLTDNKQEEPVVVVQRLFKKYFQLELSKGSINQIMKAYKDSDQDLERVIQDAITFSFLTQTETFNPVGAVIHGLHTGWSLDKLLKSYEEEMKAMYRKEVEKKKSLPKSMQQEQPPSTLTKEELEANRMMILAKLAKTDEKLAKSRKEKDLPTQSLPKVEIQDEYTPF